MTVFVETMDSKQSNHDHYLQVILKNPGLLNSLLVRSF
jgi:hypothetical protein